MYFPAVAMAPMPEEVLDASLESRQEMSVRVADEGICTRWLTAVVVVVIVIVVVVAGRSSSIGGVGGEAGGGAGGLHAVDITGVDGGDVPGVVQRVRDASLGGGGEATQSLSDRFVEWYSTANLQRLGVSGNDLTREGANAEADKGDSGEGGGDTSIDAAIGDSLGCHVHAAGAGRVIVAVILRIAGVRVLSESWGSNGAEEEEALDHLHLDGGISVGLMGCERGSRASGRLGWRLRLRDEY